MQEQSGLNLALSKVGNPPIYDPAVFPWAGTIEREWRAIRAELDRVLTRKDELPGFHKLATDVATISHDRGWKTFLLAGYGFRSDNNIKLCPETWRICQEIPGLITVMFSILEPGKHLPPHRGPYNGVLRLHLGLIVPEPREDLGIRVEDEIYRWNEGEAVIFDDAYEHEAWNRTKHTRVVLSRRFPEAFAFPCQFHQLVAAAFSRVYAFYSRGNGQPESLGEALLRRGRVPSGQIGYQSRGLLFGVIAISSLP